MKGIKAFALCVAAVLCFSGILLLCSCQDTPEELDDGEDSNITEEVGELVGDVNPMSAGIGVDFAFNTELFGEGGGANDRTTLVHVSVEKVFPGIFERDPSRPDICSLLIEGRVIHDFFAFYQPVQPDPWIEEGEPIYLWIDLQGNNQEEKEAYGQKLKTFFQKCDSLILHGNAAERTYPADSPLIICLRDLVPKLALTEKEDGFSLSPAVTVVERKWMLVPIQNQTFALSEYYQALDGHMLGTLTHKEPYEMLYWGQDGQTEAELYETAREIARISVRYRVKMWCRDKGIPWDEQETS